MDIDTTGLETLQIDWSSFQRKHLYAISLAEHPLCENLMWAGGIGSGKTTNIYAVMISRALSAPDSQHGIFHAYRNTAYRNLLGQSFKETCNYILPGYYDWLVKNKRINKVESTVEFHNGAKFFHLGLRDNSNLRGLNLSTAWINEANRNITYEDFTTVKGRLRATAYKVNGEPLDHKMFIDLNPTVKSSWEYQSFVEGVIPNDGKPIERHRKHWYYVKINARDNEANLPPGSIEKMFNGMSDEQRARDELGLWGEDNPSALFDLQNISRRYMINGDLSDPETMKEYQDLIDSMDMVTVNIDPASTANKNSDQTGIVVTGKRGGEYFVFDDFSMKAKPHVWINEADKLRQRFNADYIVSEEDCGKDILKDLIQQTIPAAPVLYVQSRGRGKRLRAEPIAALYAKGLVHHVRPMRALEQQMIEFDSENFKGSPDRVDALVYGLGYLSGEQKKSSVGAYTVAPNFWRR